MIFLKKYCSPIIFLAALISTNCFAANDAVPVLLRVAAARQDVNRGYNFVKQFDELIYKEITEGRARLWDSPTKEIQLTGSSLTEIEKSSGTVFIEQPAIFIYEKWIKADNEIQTVTLGFTFINKNQQGDDVAYGYVEYNDVSDALLQNALNVNADGDCNIKIAYALQTKQFDFSIVQFNGETIINETGSEKIKKEFVSGLGFNGILFPIQHQIKCISYVLEPPLNLDDTPSQLTNEIIMVVQGYLKEHVVTFSDWGGSLLKEINSTDDIKVSKIEVEEIWRKHAGNITTNLSQIIVFIQGQPLDAVTSADLAEAEISCNSRELTAVIKEKKMLYYISQINDQKIERIQTFQFLNALQQTDWNALNLYVAGKQ